MLSVPSHIQFTIYEMTLQFHRLPNVLRYFRYFQYFLQIPSYKIIANILLPIGNFDNFDNFGLFNET